MTSFFIDQHGCAKNQTDSELITGYLTEKGFIHTFDASSADFILINSCGFIQSAKEESINSIYEIKKNYPDAKIILTGCLAERYSKELFESIPELDGVFGNGDLSKIAEFVELCKEQRNIQTFEQKGICEGKRPVIYNYPNSAYVKITEGCSNHCSFCAIPLIRGEMRSRPASAIINEISELINRGIFEINIIGQDIAAYGTGADDINLFSDTEFEKTEYCNNLEKIADKNSTSGLSLLLKLITKIKGEFVVRFLYIHPDHFNLDILEAIKSDKRFLHYFDIPFQSGDDEIILKMARKGTSSSYKKLIENIRNVLPDCVLRTTFLTGFPGESDKAFENTKQFLKDIRPDWSGCFAYSREEDTPAYSFKNKVSSKIKEKRCGILEETQSEITTEKLNSYVGKTVWVLIEEIIQNINQENDGEGLAIGRAWFQAPDVDGCVVVRYDLDSKEENECVQPGKVVNVQVIANTGVDLDSRFISLRK